MPRHTRESLYGLSPTINMGSLLAGSGLSGAVGSAVTAQLNSQGETGLVGTLGWTIISVPSGSAVTGYTRSTSGVTEVPSNSGIYYVTFLRPSPAGDYAIVWDSGGQYAEEAFTTTSLPTTTPPPAGMCSAWIAASAVAATYGLPEGQTQASVYADAADAASLILYRLSGQRFGGVCSTTVRPCRDGCACWGATGWGGSAWGWSGILGSWNNECGDQCGCGSLSTVRLEDYPVTAVTEIRVDGQLVDPAAYRVDENRFVTRIDGAAWPTCQDLSAAKDTLGAFAITYTYGEEPPTSGILAAKELAYQLYLSGHNATDCALPAATTSVTRSGVTYQMDTIYDMLGKGTSGLRLVDAFLGSENPYQWRHKPSVWSPDLPQPPRRITT